jgi:hypothetical protein
MGVPTSEVGYTSATAGRRDHKVHKGHVVALDLKKYIKTPKLKLLVHVERIPKQRELTKFINKRHLPQEQWVDRRIDGKMM